VLLSTVTTVFGMDGNIVVRTGLKGKKRQDKKSGTAKRGEAAWREAGGLCCLSAA
jgi:hypothetical protein